MVFEPFGAVSSAIRGLDPRHWKKPHLNFIRSHYLYMIGMTIAGSIILYPGGGGMTYINALFFAAGSVTQSGLNPVNVNDTLLYQQITLWLIACLCNPIIINGFLVFVRLHWFEKRFQGVVKESQEQRRTRTRTFSRAGTQMDGELDPSRLEQGVSGKEIRVLHHTTRPNGMSGPTARLAPAQKEFVEKLVLDPHAESVSPTPPGGSNRSDGSGELAPDEMPRQDEEKASETLQAPEEHYMGLSPRLSRDITFADEVSTPGSGHAMASPTLPSVPEGRHADKHIQFIERQQRNAQTDIGTLRIPGPRDFDRGELPQELDDEDNELTRPQTRNTLAQVDSRDGRRRSRGARSEDTHADDNPRRGITINVPEHPAHRAAKDSVEEDRGNTTAFRDTLSRAKSKLSHRRNTSRGFKMSETRTSANKTFSSMTTARSMGMGESMPYLSWQPTIGRNSAFVGLTDEQREELGGIEYRALKTLRNILCWYFFGFHALGVIVFLPWIVRTNPWNGIVRSDGVNPVWWAFFTPASMFNDLGFTLTPDSMNSFGNSTLAMLLGAFLIIIGNTGFPCMLRFVIWVTSICVPAGSPLWEELRFLLDHPRRCFTLLFPSKATWWLFWVLVLLNGIDLLFFVILDLNDTVVTSLAPGFRVLDGLFQAASTRTAGFSCVNLAGLHPAIQVSYLIMMYISVFPIAISVRRTNVYEEKSLGLWGGEEDGEGEGPQQSYVGQHLRRQLSFDLWYVFLGFFIICIVEGDRLSNTNDYAFTMFSVLFEIVSAYGTVGLSLGYPGIDASFSAEFHVLSKLVIAAMMIRGRHRGLPYALDRAILLPSEKLHKKDEEATAPPVKRRTSVMDDTGWQDLHLDRYGLPTQHTGDGTQAGSMGAGRDGSPEAVMFRRTRRRSSAFTTGDGQESGTPKRKHERSRSLGFLAGGLSAGPTYSKNE